MVAPSPNVDSETVRKYKATFQGPLSLSKQEALDLLFGGDFDPLALNLDMVGLGLRCTLVVVAKLFRV
jgi:hypothetical protein